MQDPVVGRSRTALTAEGWTGLPRWWRWGGARWIAVLGAAALLLAACGAGAPQGANPSPPAGTAPAPSPVLPEAFPLPDVLASSSLSGDADSIHVQFEVGSTRAETVRFFDAELAARGWEVINRRESGSTARYRIEGHGWTGAVTVFGGLDPVEVLVQLGRTGASP